jgi:hypothetical protein
MFYCWEFVGKFCRHAMFAASILVDADGVKRASGVLYRLWCSMNDPQEVVEFLNSLFSIFATDTQSSDDDIAARIEAGRAAWSALHTQQNPTREWFEAEWKPLIPQGCDCAGSANELLDQNPPRFDSPEDFFAWSVEYHNAVNQKLIDQGDTTKKIVSMEEALAIWRP